MLAQHGYRSSARPRPLKDDALRQCLGLLAECAVQREATVHIPRIGADRGGARWDEIEPMIAETLLARCVHVTVYDLPESAGGSERSQNSQ